MNDISIVDAQFHLWDLSFKKHLWLLSKNEIDHHGDLAAIKKNYLIENYLNESKKYKIEKSVHVQAGWNANDPTEETAWLQESIIKNAHPHAIIGYVDFTRENFLTILEKHLQYAGFKGVRQVVSYDQDSYYSGCPRDFLSMSAWQNNFRHLRKYDLTFDLQIYPEQMGAAIDLVSKNENIIFIINHFAKPKFRDREYFIYWQRQIKKIAKFENVYLKLSGFGMHEPQWTEASIKPYIYEAIDCFDVDRCLFASNFPLDKLYKSFDDIYDIYFSIVKTFSQIEKNKLFSLNAKKIYQLT